jgi:hypothetical protein
MVAVGSKMCLQRAVFEIDSYYLETSTSPISNSLSRDVLAESPSEN